MLLQNVIISFPTLFVPKQINNTGDPKYGAQFLIPPDHPQLGALKADFEAVKNAGFPSGLPHRADVCLMDYQTKYQGKDYYDPRFNGWHVLSANSKAENRPSVVNTKLEPVIDPGAVFSGALVHVNFNLFSYIVGNQGVAAGLNGVMFLGVEGPMGRLDNKPTVEQMFAGMGTTATPPQQQAAPAPNAAPPPVPQTNAAPPPAPQAAKLTPDQRMTAKAGGAGYAAFIAKGWTEDAMVRDGYMMPETSF